MANKMPYPVGVLFVRGLVLPVSLLAWAAVIVLALSEKPSECRVSAFDTMVKVILTGNQ